MSGTSIKAYENDKRWKEVERLCKQGKFADANEVLVRITNDHKDAIAELKRADLMARWMEGKTLTK